MGNGVHNRHELRFDVGKQRYTTVGSFQISVYSLRFDVGKQRYTTQEMYL